MPIPTPGDVNARLLDLPAKLLQLDLMSVQDKMVAFPTGGQAGATLVSNVYNRFTTVGTLNDSAKLPSAQPGMWTNVINAAALSMNLYPQTGEFINAGTVNVPLAIPAGKTATLFCANAGQWHASMGA